MEVIMTINEKSFTIKVPYITGITKLASKALRVLFITSGKTISSVPTAFDHVVNLSKSEWNK